MLGVRRASLTWRWREALWAGFGAIPVLLLVASGHVSAGIAAGVGLLPVGLLGLRAERRKRVLSAPVGMLFGLFLLFGSAISGQAWLAVAGMFVLPLLASLLAATRPLGRLALALILPAVAVGLSFRGVSAAAPLAAWIIAGAVWMTVLSLAWPEQESARQAPEPRTLTMRQAGIWGVLLGGAAATATLIGEVSGFAHLGWAPTSALLVMRPQRDLLTHRGIGRVLATVTGALAATFVHDLALGNIVLGFVVACAVVATIGTRTSRDYVTSAGTAFLVLTLLLHGEPGHAGQSTFWARVGATLLGVGLAYLFGVVAASAVIRRRPSRPAESTAGGR